MVCSAISHGQTPVLEPPGSSLGAAAKAGAIKVAALIVMLLASAAPGLAAEMVEFDGLYVQTPRRSLFYPRADCTREPIWVVRDRGVQLDRYLGLGPYNPQRAPHGLRVRFSGLLSPPGFYGYQGRYRHEVEVRHVIFANPAAPCR